MKLVYLKMLPFLTNPERMTSIEAQINAEIAFIRLAPAQGYYTTFDSVASS